MEFIAFSDIHFDKNINKSYTLPNGISSWTKCQLDIVSQIFSYAAENNVLKVFHGGDLFDIKNRIPQDLYNSVWSTFRNLSNDGFEIYFNTGNHDFHSEISSSLKPFSDIVTVVTEPTDVVFNTTLIRIIPYSKIADNIGVPDGFKHTVLFIHEDINGLEYLGSEYNKYKKYDKQIFKDWDVVFNGHIHKSQELGNIINMGSCMRKAFGETHHTYFYHYNNGSVSKIECKSPNFIIAPGFSSKILSTIEKDDYNFYRIDIEPNELSNPIFKKYNVFPNIIRATKKKNRIQGSMSVTDEISEYISIADTELDKEKLEEIGAQLIKI